MKALALVSSCLGLLALGACARPASPTLDPRHAIAARAQLDPSTSGLVLLAVDDADGDGWDDVACGMPFVSHGSSRESGAFALLASDGSIAGPIEHGGDGETLGYFLARDFDRDGDGVDDVIVTSPALGERARSGGSILAYSPKARRFVSRCDAPAGLATLGLGVAAIEDRDGDLLADYAVIGSARADWRTEMGMLRIFSSSSGRELESVPLDELGGAKRRFAADQILRVSSAELARPRPGTASATGPSAPSTHGDVLALAATSSDRLVFVELCSGAPIVLASHVGPGFSGFGESLAPLDPRVASSFRASTWIVASRGRNVELLTWPPGDAHVRSLSVGDHAQQLGASIASCPDLDGDGVRDVLVGAPGPAERGSFYGIELKRTHTRRESSGYVLAVSSGSGQPIRRLQGEDPWFGRAVAVFENREQPERSRVAVGAGRPESPVVYVFELTTGVQVARVQLPKSSR